MTSTTSNERELTVCRLYDAPKRLIFDVWTKPEHVSRWWGCDSLVNVTCEIDLRVGGKYRYVNRDAQGNEHPFTGVFREIVPPEMLSYTQVYDVHPWSEQEALLTVTFVELDGRTTVTVKVECSNGAEFNSRVRSGTEAALGSSMDRMAELIRVIAKGD